MCIFNSKGFIKIMTHVGMLLLYSRRSLAFAPQRCNVRTFSSAATPTTVTASTDTSTGQQDTLLDPSEMGTIPYPKALSPSSIMEFQKCPQCFLFQYLWGLRQPTTPILAKGTMCHAALEQVFDLEPADRTLDNLQNLFRLHWSQQKKKTEYSTLFCEETADGDDDELNTWSVEDEREWGLAGLQLLDNYVQLEDPRLVERPNPIKREVWVRANLPVLGEDMTDDEKSNNFLVRGIVDRLDMVKDKDGSVVMRIVDYKSGKAPNFKYSAAMNAKIAEESFFQLKIYALLLKRSGSKSPLKNNLDLRILRLLHLTSVGEGPAQYLDYDLGATEEEREELLEEVELTLRQTWSDIGKIVAKQDPLLFHGCDRSFCYCHKCRPRFVPGSVWEPGL